LWRFRTVLITAGDRAIERVIARAMWGNDGQRRSNLRS